MGILEAKWPYVQTMINDCVLNNRTKEKLYKIITRAIPVVRKFSGSSTISSACAFCCLVEDEMHCFVRCHRLTPLWRWLFRTISNVCPWVLNITDVEKLFGYSIHCLHNDSNVQIWKVLHAETIRVIW
jgi:hypothetical protein